MSTSTVFIIDDDEASLSSLRWLVESIELRPEVFRTAVEFLDLYDPSRSGCLVLDVRMPEMSGLELQEILRARAIDIPIIFVTAHGDISMAVRALKFGALDFLEKPFKQQDLLDLIHKAIAFDLQRRDSRSVRTEGLKRLEQLTPRERQVMDLIAAGNLNKTIASILGLSTKTVEVYRGALMKKLGAKCASDLIRIAFEMREDR